MKTLLALFTALCAFFYSDLALAGALGPFTGAMTPTGAMAYYGSNAYSKAQASMGVGSRWNPDILATSGLGVSVTQKIAIPTGAGAANTTMSGMITPAGVVATMGAILGGPWGAAATIGVMALPAVLDWLNTADVRPNASNTGMERKDPAVCSVAPCTGWKMGNWTASIAPTIAESARLGCIAAGGGVALGAGYPYHVSNYNGYPGYMCTAYQFAPDYSFAQVSIAPKPAVWIPATYPDYQQRLSGVAVSTALINALLDAGYTFPLDGPSVTGPASITGPSSITSTTGTNPAGESVTTTTTSTPTSTQTYGNGPAPVTGSVVPTVTTSTVTTTTTNVYNNTTNSNVSNTTTTQATPDKAASEDAKKQEDMAYSDKDFSEVPKLYERKYPDGLTGVWSAKITAIKATPLFSLVGQLMPSLASSGSCPSWPVPLNFASWATYGTKDVAPPCWVWDFGKTVIIISSLLLARRLIFGG